MTAETATLSRRIDQALVLQAEPEPTESTIPIELWGDTHIGKINPETGLPLPEAITREEFIKNCERLSQDSSVKFVLFMGDILDKDATEEDIKAVEEGLKLLKNKTVIYVWANNEDRLQQKDQRLRARLEQTGAKVIQDGMCVVEYEGKDENGDPEIRQLAFVVASRIIPPAQMRDIMERYKDDPAGQIVAVRQVLNNGEQLKVFEDNLHATVIRGKEPQTNIPTKVRIPTFVLVHSLGEPLEYYNYYAGCADDPRLQDEKEGYTETVVQQQKDEGNILGVIFAHVEGGPRTFFYRGIRYINSCSVVVGRHPVGVN